MRTLSTLVITLIVFQGFGQTKLEDSAPVNGQEKLRVKFDFADEIKLQTWDRNEVKVEASVSINDGEDDDMFQIEKSVRDNSILFEMDELNWKDRTRRSKKNCWQSDIFITIYFPESMEIDAESISAGYVLDYYGKPLRFKTISGDIDLNVSERYGMDFKVKTISGEVYTDLKIEYPYGKKGLRQIVGTNVEGQIKGGGAFSDFETISGNIYLRKQ